MAQSDPQRKNIVNTILIVLIGQVGCLTLAVILGSVLLGLWLDRLFDTRPVITLALLIAGIPLSVFLMLFVSRRTLAKLREQAETSQSPADRVEGREETKEKEDIL